jgi:hypothetical protein
MIAQIFLGVMKNYIPAPNLPKANKGSLARHFSKVLF